MPMSSVSPAALVAAAMVMLLANQPATRAQHAGTVSDAPSFDAASVKRNTMPDGNTRWTPEPGRLTAVNVTLTQMISTAYGPPEQPLADFQMSGGPSWIRTSRFDVQASAPGATPVQMIPMLRRLLEDRFDLHTHFETRRLPIYSLVRVHRDGTLGPKMRRSTADCAALARGPATERCGGGQIHPGTLTARGVNLTRIVSGLARIMPGVSRFVVDRTGLTGLFDIDLTWTPTPVEFPAMNDPAMRAQMAIDPNGPSLFTALQEQWGLKLEPGTGPVPVLVVDAATPPTED